MVTEPWCCVCVCAVSDRWREQLQRYTSTKSTQKHKRIHWRKRSRISGTFKHFQVLSIISCFWQLNWALYYIYLMQARIYKPTYKTCTVYYWYSRVAIFLCLKLLWSTADVIHCIAVSGWYFHYMEKMQKLNCVVVVLVTNYNMCESPESILTSQQKSAMNLTALCDVWSILIYFVGLGELAGGTGVFPRHLPCL